MATQVQLRRGTSTQNDSFTGAQGELTFDTTNKRVRIHDGATAGGFELKTENAGGDTLFGDNEKAIFGAGSDLKIYHDGSNSYIKDTGIGNLVIGADAFTYIGDPSATTTAARFNATGAQVFNHNNVQKLATTATGIDVTGTVTSDGLTVDGDAVVKGLSPQLFIQTGNGNYNFQIAAQESVNNAFEIASGGTGIDAPNDTYTKRLVVQNNGDISFYEDTGTTAKFFWDASAESLGIGASSFGGNYDKLAVAGGITIQGDSSGKLEIGRYGSGAPNSYIKLGANSSSLRFTNNADNADLVTIENGGNVGIGTSSPSESLTNRGNIFIETNSTSANSGNGLFWQSTTSGWSTSTAHAAIYGKRTDASNGYLRFDTRQSGTTQEAMRIDSSGNVLVGTAASFVGGVTISPLGVVSAERNNISGVFNRTSTEGEIVQFRKDGSPVGSISVKSDDFVIHSLVQNHVGLSFGDGNLLPTNYYGTTSNNTVDIGSTSRRFKDLYLSGGIEIENGSGNVGVGKQALNSNTAGSNTAVGYQAAYSNTTGQYNTAIGTVAGLSNTEGSSNTYLGEYAGRLATGGNNTFLGAASGHLVTTGNNNTILGRFTGNQGGLDIRTTQNNIVLSDGDGNPRLRVSNDGSTFFGPNMSSVSGTTGGAAFWTETQNRKTLYLATTGAGLPLAYFASSGGFVGSISVSSGSTSYNTSSDYRLKENIDYTWDATTRLKQLKPARFNFIADADTTVDGFLAHEAQAVVPEAVTGTHNEVDADGNAVMQGIDQSKLVPLLVKTIQELEARITTLENA